MSRTYTKQKRIYADRSPHPTSLTKRGRGFFDVQTRPVTKNMANLLMESAYSLLTATSKWPEVDPITLAIAREKAIAAFKSYRYATNGGWETRRRNLAKKKEQADEGGGQQPAPVDDPRPGLQPGNDTDEGGQRS